ncbi:uncharacterized protein [Venturia canescens]|uniref:uncharacterized protein n=1 Tax=Venturia canescens TaxID=32260 RepID=UPI001C9CAE76|nr:uncharacterized protein LOC122407976 [Venturia canescens]
MEQSEDSYFYSNVCHVCRVYGKDIKLKRCANCTQIAYCSREHQKQHWPQHKEFCQALGKLQKPLVGFPQINFPEVNRVFWITQRFYLSQLIKASLRRELSPAETDILMFPRCCKICHEMDFSKLRDCSECPDTTFCIKHPKDSEHASDCEKSKLRFDYRNVTRDMHPGWVRTIPLNYGASIPKNINEATEFILSHFTQNEIGKLGRIWSAMTTELLTRVYTFLFAIQKLPRPKSRRLRIHVIGGDKWEVSAVIWWQYLFHHDESLKELEIVIISPLLPDRSINGGLCDKCKKSNRKVNVKVKRGLYAEFAASSHFTKPDFVVAFNFDIRDFAAYNPNTWSSSIEAVAEIGCPFLMTALDAEISNENRNKINEILEKYVKTFWAGDNPYPGGIPHRGHQPHDLCCSNQYLVIYETLTQKKTISRKLERKVAKNKENDNPSLRYCSRPLPFLHREMIAYRRSCEICHEMDPQKLYDCKECPGASFCIEHPKDDEHTAKCSKIKLSFEYSNAAYNYKHTLPFCSGNNVPKNIDQVIQLYSLHCPMDKGFPTSELWMVFLSEQLTRPYTFLYCMEKLSLPKSQIMTIHVIGSNFKEMENVQLWQNLLWNDKSLKELNIVFIGPTLKTNFFEIVCPNEDTKIPRKLKIYCEGLVYHDFAIDQSFTIPDYVIGFNLGFCAFPPEDDTWALTIKFLTDLACPVCITSYAAFEMELDQNRIELFLNDEVKPLWYGKNPFSGLAPIRNYEVDEFAYNNQYLTIYEKLA